MADQSPFPQDALEANRAGRLTDWQRRNIRGMSRGLRKGELQMAGVFTVIGLLVWFAEGPAKYATVKPLLGIGFLIIAGFLLARSLMGADTLTADLRSGRVESVEGAISKHTVSGGRSSPSTHYFDVQGRRIEVGRAAYDAAPDAGFVRVYYLPRRKLLVNMERLPDQPLPAGATGSPQAIVQGLAAAIHSHNETATAEARARMAAMADAMKSQLSDGAAPPPEGQRDPRPLAQAIVGTWSGGPISVTFAPDGTVRSTMPGGGQRSGHWSVDSSGKLETDVLGHDQAADAWITGDQLTISAQGMGFSFKRVS